MAKKIEAVQVKVRMTKDLQRRIQREADRHGQTINAEILSRLELSFEHEKERAIGAAALKRAEIAIADSQKAIAESQKARGRTMHAMEEVQRTLNRILAATIQSPSKEHRSADQMAQKDDK